MVSNSSNNLLLYRYTKNKILDFRKHIEGEWSIFRDYSDVEKRIIDFITERFEINSLTSEEALILGFLITVTSYWDLYQEMQRFYPNIRMPNVPKEFIIHVMDPIGDKLLIYLDALSHNGNLHKQHLIEIDGYFVRLKMLFARDSMTQQLEHIHHSSVIREPKIINLSIEGRFPEQTIHGIEEVITWWINRESFMKKTFFQRLTQTSSTNLVVLLYGSEGVGNTLAPRYIASKLGLELWRISTPRLLSRWVGESEAMLSDIFTKANHHGSALLFENADDIFSARTVVSSSNDRYSNLLVDVFIQELDRFSGLVMLVASNPERLDKAIVRRINVRVFFPLPDKRNRTKIWQSYLKHMEGFTDEDFTYLGENFSFSMEEIESCVVTALTRSLENREKLRLSHIIDACISRAIGKGDLVKTGGYDEYKK